ncbi:MAG: hypothetical protein A2284_17580 [Deltaproteobacteria bacterium RIFOXYA12_FULL_61_11]|nr:MAG: hypothetical protein A2284_17580 [Deltaproteobacteria bacterium RIFOXYA12_FULL_61_11]
MSLFKKVVLIGILIGAVVLIAEFVNENATRVSLTFLSFHREELPLYLVLLLSFAAGGFTVLCLGLLEVLRSERRNRGLRKQLAGLKQQLDSLKTIPLVEQDEEQ